MKRRSTCIDTKIFNISFFPGFQLIWNLVFLLIFPFLLIFIFIIIFWKTTKENSA